MVSTTEVVDADGGVTAAVTAVVSSDERVLEHAVAETEAITKKTRRGTTVVSRLPDLHHRIGRAYSSVARVVPRRAGSRLTGAGFRRSAPPLPYESVGGDVPMRGARLCQSDRVRVPPDPAGTDTFCKDWNTLHS